MFEGKGAVGVRGLAVAEVALAAARDDASAEDSPATLFADGHVAGAGCGQRVKAYGCQVTQPCGCFREPSVVFKSVIFDAL